MKVHEVVRPTVTFAVRHQSLSEVAKLMRKANVGIVPVVADKEGRELVGVVTDRDIALRGLGLQHDSAKCCVSEVMSRVPLAVGGSEPLGHALHLMAKYQVRRLPVVTEGRRLVGVVSIEDLIRSAAVPSKDCLFALKRMHARKRAKRILNAAAIPA